MGGCLQGPGGGEQAGLLYPPHPNSYQSGHRELSILPTPPPTLSHMNVLGTDSGQTCDSAHGTRKAPALSLGLETQVSRPRGGDQEAGFGPSVAPVYVPRRALSADSLQSTGLGEGGSGAWALLLRTALFHPSPAEDVGLINTLTQDPCLGSRRGHQSPLSQRQGHTWAW